MPQPNDLNRSLVALDQDSTLIADIETSEASWLVGAIVPGVERHPLKKLALDEEELLRLVQRWREEATKAERTIGRIAVRSGRLLAGPLAAGARHRGLTHPCLERSGLARASARQDRSPGCRAVEARPSRLAAGEARPLQNGRDPPRSRWRTPAAEP
jgi:hypothetical protein